MGEKETYLEVREREFSTTLRVLRAYPADGDLKLHEKLKSARELAFTFASEEKMLLSLLKTKEFPKEWPAVPETMEEAISAYEEAHAETTAYVTRSDEDFLNSPIPFMVAPKTKGEMRAMDILWMILHDLIHHRGQFSVYLRVAGGKVPSIYGPSADEPWM